MRVWRTPGNSPISKSTADATKITPRLFPGLPEAMPEPPPVIRVEQLVRVWIELILLPKLRDT